jgi:hypothetical protein
LDAKKLKKDVEIYLDAQFRFKKLQKTSPELAGRLRKDLKDWIHKRHDHHLNLGRDEYE